MGFDFIFDEKLGTHKIVNNSELENTPVFFTSMLTGQRALDNGSFGGSRFASNDDPSL